jgi:hypothetical protein
MANDFFYKKVDAYNLSKPGRGHVPTIIQSNVGLKNYLTNKLNN